MANLAIKIWKKLLSFKKKKITNLKEITPQCTFHCLEKIWRLNKMKI
jgi:hypothetical protein